MRSPGALLAVLLALGAATSAAPPEARYEFPRVTARDGLPHNTVFGIFQDRRGFLWIATEAGVCRYDGARCEVYGVREGLADPVARAFAEDREGRIWIATEGGVSRWDGGRIVSFGTEHGLPHRRVFAALCTRAGRLFFGTNDGLALWDGQRFQAFGREAGLPAAPIWSLLEEPDGALLVATRGGGVVRFGGSRAEPWAAPLRSPAVFGLARDAAGAVWVASDAGLSRYASGQLATWGRGEGLASERVGSVTTDPRGIVWFGVFGSGLGRLFQGRAELLQRRNGVPDRHITTLHVDREGSVWCGTRSAGVFRLSEPAFALHDEDSGLASGRVTGLAEAGDGTLWTTSLGGGLTALSPSGLVRRFGAAQGLADELWCLHLDRQGRIWAGGYQGAYRLQGERVSAFTSQQIGVGDRITSIAEGPDGAVYLASETARAQGLSRFDGQGFRLLGPAEGFGALGVNSLAAGSGGALWIGTNGALVRFQDGVFRTFAGGLPGRNVNVVHHDAAGQLWVGLEAGLCRFDGERCVQTFARGDGLANASVRSLDSRDGRLLVGTSGGLYALARNELRRLTPEVFSDEIVPVLSARDGIWFGTGAGAVRFRSAEDLDSPAPLVEIAAARSGARLLPPGRIELGPADGELTIDYRALAFRDPASLRYRVRLSGVDPGFVSTDERSARYVGVPPGDHRFEVQAAAGASAWSEIAAVDVRVRPAFHRTPAFQAMAAAGALFLLGGALGLLRQRQRARVAALREDQERRLRELSDLLASVRGINSSLEVGTVLERIGQEGARLVGGRPRSIALVERGVVVRERAFRDGAWHDAVGLPAAAVSQAASGSGAVPVAGPPWALALPIARRDGSVVGVLELCQDSGPFGPEQRQVMEALAEQAAPALEHAALYQQLGERSAQVEQARRELEGLYRRETETSRALAALNKMKSDFIVLASHELRTPLTVVKGHTEAWLAGLFGPLEPVLAESVQACHRMVQRLTGVSANILEALRLEGQPVLRRERVDLAALARGLVDDFATFARERRQDLSFVARGECRIVADPQKVELVLVNLLQNAIKFTPDGGHVRVVVGPCEEGVQLAVEDDGIGIEPGEQERVFDAFYTASDVWQHSSGSGSFAHLARGPGLGLAIARGYVEAQGGRIRALSDGPGRGSRFVVVWPAAGE